jgi:hypothetical protein
MRAVNVRGVSSAVCSMTEPGEGTGHRNDW